MTAPILVANESYVVDYCNSHGFGAANENGASPQNAVKHALFLAMNYCKLGEQHAVALGEFHETCNGVNQNPNEAERVMDRYNNARGIAIAKTTGCSNIDNLVNAVKTAYNTGVLHDITGQGTP